MKKRELYELLLERFIDTPLVKIIIGIRRSGKSYLLRLLEQDLLSKGVKQSNILRMDFESLSIKEYSNYKSLYDYVRNKAESVSGKIYILIDEIQEVSGWEKAIRSFLVDLDCDIYLTGSNAHLLSGELATYLAGRFVEIPLYTLSFLEYMTFNNIDKNKSGNREEAFLSWLKQGGFPGLYHLPADDEVIRQYILGIYNSVVLKDVIQRFGIRDSELLERIFLYILDNVGQLFSGKKIADYLKNQGHKISVETVYSHLKALENGMIIHSARRYDIKGKKYLQRLEKYFVADLGLRYALIGYRDNDISQLLENIIYMELRRRGFSVCVGKEGEYEVDFIAEKQDQKVYIQVCYLLATEEVIEREYHPLKVIKDNHRKIVISMDKIPIGLGDGIEWMNCEDFLCSGSF
ncbi:MAG: ATP-binding protein [Spirochaetales bacterium]|nr:ATP-binding protein [Spirochaetales bacterium]